MRKCLAVLGMITLLCLWVSPAMAGGIINKSNLSSDYFRSLTRNAATDAADIVVYNPAGVMKMPNGFYTKLDVMYITKDYENTVPDISPFPGEDGFFESDKPSIVPGIFAVYKQDRWAGFFAVTVPGGGGDVEYDNGSAFSSLIGLKFSALGATGIADHYLEANSYAFGYTLGGAFAINDKISLAGGVRYVDSYQEYSGYIDWAAGSNPILGARSVVDIERDASGVSFLLGANIAPTDKLNIGFQYVSNTHLNYDSKATDTSPGAAITTQAGWADGTSRREDLPGLLGFGVSYNFTPKLRTELNWTLYLESDAELSSASGRWDDAGNSYDLALSLEYAFNPKWKVSMGYMITRIEDMDPDELIPLAPELDANTIAVGGVYAPNDHWRFNLGLTNVDYEEVTNNNNVVANNFNSTPGTEMDKHSIAISLGIQYRFF